ncbi:MAG TPA: exo-alpha-sialidase [Luteolibacter sp.]|nr:exo-alpha-sialidase [Luteolibacter sp.]
MKTRALPLFALLAIPLAACAQTSGLQNLEQAATAMPSGKVPGTVIAYSPQSSGRYIGSPGLTILPNGDYLASHDWFGPKSTEHQRAITVVLRSSDRGASWREVARVHGAFWQGLFVHRGTAYLMGTDRHHGRIVIRRSTDHGSTWTDPRNGASGLLTPAGEYHTAPVPVIEHNGRLWRGFEDAGGSNKWGERYRAGMLSIPVDADLLNANNWIYSNFLPSERSWNGGDMRAWLEGNAVLARDGQMLNILRVETIGYPEKAAIVRISPDGRTASFDPETGFIPFPGGAKKFTIRHDAISDLYWSIVNSVPERHQSGPRRPGGIRNTLALAASRDLRQWDIRCILLYHPDIARHGFQYVDWLFDGDDLIAVCRTACDDDQGGARNHHDANFLTFHRWKNFRSLTMADSVPMPEKAQQRVTTADLIVTGEDWTLAPLANGRRAFANRRYVWRNVPTRLTGWRFTLLGGGERSIIRVKATRDTVVHFATALSQSGVNTDGWAAEPELSFAYTDTGRTRMNVFTRALKAGDDMEIPQGNWSGGLLLLPHALEKREP